MKYSIWLLKSATNRHKIESIDIVDTSSNPEGKIIYGVFITNHFVIKNIILVDNWPSVSTITN